MIVYFLFSHWVISLCLLISIIVTVTLYIIITDRKTNIRNGFKPNGQPYSKLEIGKRTAKINFNHKLTEYSCLP